MTTVVMDTFGLKVLASHSDIRYDRCFAIDEYGGSDGHKKCSSDVETGRW